MGGFQGGFCFLPISGGFVNRFFSVVFRNPLKPLIFQGLWSLQKDFLEVSRYAFTPLTGFWGIFVKLPFLVLFTYLILTQ